MIKARRNRRAGNVIRTGEMRNTYKVLAANPHGKRGIGI
jgi:hypothetical protein